MLTTALVLSASGIVFALIAASVIYIVGVYLFHAPQPLVGVLAFLIFVLLLLSDVGSRVTS